MVKNVIWNVPKLVAQLKPIHATKKQGNALKDVKVDILAKPASGNVTVVKLVYRKLEHVLEIKHQDHRIRMKSV